MLEAFEHAMIAALTWFSADMGRMLLATGWATTAWMLRPKKGSGMWNALVSRMKSTPSYSTAK